MATDGAVHVALGNNAWKLKLPHEQWGYFYTRMLPGEKSFSPLRNINHKPSEGFSLAMNDKGLVTAVWMADKLYANVSEDGGKTFAATVEIDPVLNPCNCCTTSSTYGADGRLAILYREETNDERDMYLALWDQANHQVTKTRISTTPWKIDSCPMTYYSVVPSGEGYLAAWPTKVFREAGGKWCPDRSQRDQDAGGEWDAQRDFADWDNRRSDTGCLEERESTRLAIIRSIWPTLGPSGLC